ncbi:PaaI family thioesterase [Pseudoroseicyclus aestuarii]|uniref:Acyl-coenzyme A thioesterase PaaI-like protein n=1 Tax=Pseudoroseicyclus aestuarii TaxID=1795041 RepID=A0A318SVG4_9RHOB|nr:hotdog domain-containing protein [Pseudoroseicyclus aestuarii]PYE85482.1 acyl-coenzyme A thioesterase PaaI-like protein [Pseudoroseicyclus aestuarii]
MADLLDRLVEQVPYLGFLGIRLDRHGDELTVVLPFKEALIGNPVPRALHGGATAAFLEVTAVGQLCAETGLVGTDQNGEPGAGWPLLPRTIDFTIDYLRPGLPRDAYARAHVSRAGRRFASVRVEAWQEARARPFAQAVGHFLMPPRPGSGAGA